MADVPGESTNLEERAISSHNIGEPHNNLHDEDFQTVLGRRSSGVIPMADQNIVIQSPIGEQIPNSGVMMRRSQNIPLRPTGQQALNSGVMMRRRQNIPLTQRPIGHQAPNSGVMNSVVMMRRSQNIPLRPIGQQAPNSGVMMRRSQNVPLSLNVGRAGITTRPHQNSSLRPIGAPAAAGPLANPTILNRLAQERPIGVPAAIGPLANPTILNRAQEGHSGRITCEEEDPLYPFNNMVGIIAPPARPNYQYPVGIIAPFGGWRAPYAAGPNYQFPVYPFNNMVGIMAPAVGWRAPYAARPNYQGHVPELLDLLQGFGKGQEEVHDQEELGDTIDLTLRLAPPGP